MDISKLIIILGTTISSWLSANQLSAIDTPQMPLFVYICLGCIIILIALHNVLHIPSFIYRKLLHLVAVFLTTYILYGAPSWQYVLVLSGIILLCITPILKFLERYSWFGKFFVEKSTNEIVRSFNYLFIMLILLSSIAWGIFGQKWICILSVLLWGMGDASAAIIGITFGTHKIPLSLSDGKKSFEGSLAMFIVCSLICFTFLFILNGYPILEAVSISLLASLIATIIELVSSSELDTFFVPLGVMFFFLLIASLCGL